MEPLGGAPSAQACLDTIQAGLQPEFFEDGRTDAGAPLLLVLACRLQDRALDDEMLRALSVRCQSAVSELLSIASFCDALIASARGEGPAVTLCRGLTCNLHGAPRLHEEILRLMAEKGLEPPTEKVHCLSQCDHGPSVMVDKSIWVTRGRKVVEDQRGWREPDTGPVPISDTSRPKRD